MAVQLAHSLGKRVRAIRRYRDLSVREVAERVEPFASTLTESVITNIERPVDGKRAPRAVTVQELFAIAHVLDVPPVWILLPDPDGVEIEVLPGVVKSSIEAMAWLTGLRELIDAAGPHNVDIRATPIVRR